MFNTRYNPGHRLYRCALLMAVVVVLSGCTSMQELGQKMVDDVRQGLTYGFPHEGPAHDVAIQEPADMNAMASYMSYGSVDVYSLDAAPGPSMQQAFAPSAADYNEPVPVSGNSSVTVYPVGSAGYTRSTISPRPATTGRDYLASVTPPPPTQVYQSSYAGYDQQQEGSVSAYPAVSDYGYTATYAAPVAASSVETARVYFGHGKTSVDRDGMKVIDYVVREQSAQPDSSLKVEGHASTRAEHKDPVERKIANLKTSMDRAMNVSRALIRKGVPSSSIQTTAYGDTRPPSVVAAGGSVEAASRRVEISRPAY